MKADLVIGAEYETKDGMRVRLRGPLYRDSLGDRTSPAPGAKEARGWCVVVGKNGPFRIPEAQLRPVGTWKPAEPAPCPRCGSIGPEPCGHADAVGNMGRG